MFWRGPTCSSRMSSFPRTSLAVDASPTHLPQSRVRKSETKKRKGGSGTDYAIRTHWAAKRTRYAATTKMAKSMSHLRGFGYLERAPCRRGGSGSLGGIEGGHPPRRADWEHPRRRRPGQAPQDRESRGSPPRDRWDRSREPEERVVRCVRRHGRGHTSEVDVSERRPAAIERTSAMNARMPSASRLRPVVRAFLDIRAASARSVSTCNRPPYSQRR